MKRTMHRAGLHIYRTVTLDTTTDSKEAVAELLRGGTPALRRERVERRAAEYADVPEIAQELETIRDIATLGRERELHLALVAIERGLDLLDTGRHLDAILREQKTSEGRKKGAAIANAQRAKLPSAEELVAEIERLRKGRQLSDREARSAIRNKYKVSSSALSQKLSPTKKQ